MRGMVDALGRKPTPAQAQAQAQAQGQAQTQAHPPPPTSNPTQPHQPTPTPSLPTLTHALTLHSTLFTHAPAHHTATLALHHRFPAYAHTVRLVQRWLGAHWLSARVGVEAVELVCAAVFLEGGAGAGAGVGAGETGTGTGAGTGGGVDVPMSGKRGFVRVLRFLRAWDGVAYVPLYEAVRGGAAKGESGGGGGNAGGRGRGEAGGTVAWRLATAEDAAGTVWCGGVTRAVAARVRNVADATVVCLEEGTLSVLPLFQHPTSDYDFLITLHPHAVSTVHQALNPPTSTSSGSYANNPLNLNTLTDETPFPRVGFNPALLFFRDLQRIYADTLELFYDIHGGTTIGGVWDPRVAGQQHGWRVFLGFSSVPASEESATIKDKEKGTGKGARKGKSVPEVVFNAEGVLAEIARIGEGIVKSITTRG
ncbi:hypothetical protein K439DRAFT_932497 [Ramaria rubella]|nr:hypothetical protein K439DRAFT_932497 [Ramaria rubella]